MCRSMRRLSWGKALLLALAVAVASPVAAGPAESVLAAVNAARAKAGCGPLRLNGKLVAAAKGHAKAMAEQNFFGHAGKDGSRFSSRIKRQGYDYRAAAENIAAGQKSAGQVVASWMKSSGPPAQHPGLPDEGDRDRAGLSGRRQADPGQSGRPEILLGAGFRGAGVRHVHRGQILIVTHNQSLGFFRSGFLNFRPRRCGTGFAVVRRPVLRLGFPQTEGVTRCATC